ncbi:SEC-C metal-binding domain-containing protein [Planctomycetota bacterium]
MTKIGRNAPCPCGSGKKFKKCCLPLQQKAEKQQPPPDATPPVRVQFDDDLDELDEVPTVSYAKKHRLPWLPVVGCDDAPLCPACGWLTFHGGGPRPTVCASCYHVWPPIGAVAKIDPSPAVSLRLPTSATIAAPRRRTNTDPTAFRDGGSD